jgi:uncharacterized protein
MKLFLSALGLMLIFEGLPYFMFPDKLKGWLNRLLKLPDSQLRWFGLVSLVVGVILIYLTRRLR